ncbi:hypothetical protein [Streptomyces finlayi]|nr:hypothetical protein [Streptomyces finlayi]
MSASASAADAEERDQELEPELELELERDVAPQPEPEPHSVQARDAADDEDSAPAVERDVPLSAGSADASSAGTSVLTSLFGGKPVSGPEADADAGTDASARARPDAGATPDAGAGLDELALRRLLRGAVQDLEPSSGTLDHLHRAVPARRARRRQAVVGVAAAALLIGTAVPAFVHVARSDGDNGVNSAIAGHGEQAQGGSGEEPAKEPWDDKEPGPADNVTDGDEGEPDVSESPSSGGDGDVPDPKGNGGVADTPRSEAPAVSSCGPNQLSVVSAESGAPGADGTVYGTFRISNMSSTQCSVSGAGSVGVQAMGAADPLKVQVVRHTAGDPASGLPDPSLEPGVVMLKPSMAYEVRFAWVPSDTCPSTVPPPSPTPTDGAGGTTGEDMASGGPEAQFAGEDGGTQDGGIVVTHTAEAGAPSLATTISNACAGTVYRTGVLAAS